MSTRKIKKIREVKLKPSKNKTEIPKMMTIRQVADTGILPEHAIRTMVKNNAIPYISSGNTVYINFRLLCNKLNNLSV